MPPPACPAVRLIFGFILLVIALPASATPPNDGPAERRIAITIDDGPLIVTHDAQGTAHRARIVDGLLGALAAHEAPATLFVVGEEVAKHRDGEALLRRWIEAGVALGNHTWHHYDYDRIAPTAFLDDVRRLNAYLRGLGVPVRHYRAPYLRTGGTEARQTALRETLDELGLRDAPVTVDSEDWRLNTAYEAAVVRGDRAEQDRLGEAYLDQVFDHLVRAEAQALHVAGRPVPHILLLHANAINADHLGALLDGLRGVGYRFVSLDEALADPVYRVPAPPDAEGLPWLTRLAEAYPHGLPVGS